MKIISCLVKYNTTTLCVYSAYLLWVILQNVNRIQLETNKLMHGTNNTLFDVSVLQRHTLAVSRHFKIHDT